MADQTVAKTILAQLGGRRFLAMTGAKNLTSSETTLTFALPRGVRRREGAPVILTHVSIELTKDDTYKMSFLDCRMLRSGLKREVLEVHDGIYAEDLRRLFTETTGLDTHL